MKENLHKSIQVSPAAPWSSAVLICRASNCIGCVALDPPTCGSSVILQLDQRSQDHLQLWRQRGLGHQWRTSDIQAASVVGFSNGEAGRLEIQVIFSHGSERKWKKGHKKGHVVNLGQPVAWIGDDGSSCMRTVNPIKYYQIFTVFRRESICTCMFGSVANPTTQSPNHQTMASH